MSRVGWLWGNRATKSDQRDDEVDEDFLQNQLHAEITSQDMSQNSPLLQKKKRKSRELDGDSEQNGVSQQRKKKKKKKHKSRQNSMDVGGDLDVVLNSVLAHMDESVGNLKSPQPTEHQPKEKVNSAKPPAKSKSHVEQASIEGDAIGKISIESKTVKKQPPKDPTSAKTSSPIELKDSQLKNLTPSTANRRTSFVSSAALLATIMKSSRGFSPANTGQAGMERLILPPKKFATPLVNVPARPAEIPKSSELKKVATDALTDDFTTIESNPDRNRKTSQSATPEDSQKTEASPEATMETVLEPVKVKGNTKPSKNKRASGLWRTASMKATLPMGYTPGPQNDKKRYHCPVRTCDKSFSRKTTMGQHMNIIHAGAVYVDNGDGTLSIEGAGGTDDSGSEGEYSSKPATSPMPNGQVSVKKGGQAMEIYSESDYFPAPETKKRGRRSDARAVHRFSDIQDRPRGNSRKDSSLNGIDLIKSTSSASALLPPSRRQSRSESLMEDWEIKPGRIQGSIPGSDDNEKDIAFSSAFITSNKNGVNLPGIQFTILHLPGGATHNWKSDEKTLRVCSVATGKVHVVIRGQDFAIGAHGMWRVRGGEPCEVVNQNYREAVIHVSAVDEEE